MKTDGIQFVLWPHGMLLSNFKEDVLQSLFELVQDRLNVFSLTVAVTPERGAGSPLPKGLELPPCPSVP